VAVAIAVREFMTLGHITPQTSEHLRTTRPEMAAPAQQVWASALRHLSGNADADNIWSRLLAQLDLQPNPDVATSPAPYAGSEAAAVGLGREAAERLAALPDDRRLTIQAALRELPDVGVGYAYLDAADNSGRRAVLLGALPGGPAVIAPLSRLAKAYSTTIEDTADAAALDEVKRAMTPPYEVSPGRGIPGLREAYGAASQWTSHVLPLRQQFPQYEARLATVLARKFAPCV
jgi:hypothetical protein